MTNQFVNQDMVYTAEMLKWNVFEARPMPAESSCLLIYVGSYWDGSSANPVVHPSMARTCIALGVTVDELPDIAKGFTQTLTLDELESGVTGVWAVHYADDDSRSIVSYQPMNLDLIRAYRGKFKDVRISVNALKAGSRYLKDLKAGLARAMTLLAIAKTKSVYNDFGWSKCEYGTAPHRIWHHNRYGKLVGAKMQHNAQFTNSLLLNRTPAGYGELIEVRELTDEFVKDSFNAVLTFKEISDKFLLNGNYSAITEAIAEINAAGWHTAEITKNGDDMSLWQVTVTPTRKFHQLVWDLDFNAPGSLLSRWELANGFIPVSDDRETENGDPMTTLPKLGYHYLYGISSAKTGAFVTVGQTTQSLTSRLHQHERSASNIEANDSILNILRDPTDSLRITHFATVHNSIASQKEVSLAHAMLAKGHAITNKILTTAENARTVKLDSRFNSDEFKNNFRAVQEKLDSQLENYGKEIFMIDKLPEATAVPIDPESVRWLFDTLEFPDTAEQNIIQETRTYDELMWEAEERGAYDEMAALPAVRP